MNKHSVCQLEKKTCPTRVGCFSPLSVPVATGSVCASAGGVSVTPATASNGSIVITAATGSSFIGYTVSQGNLPPTAVVTNNGSSIVISGLPAGTYTFAIIAPPTAPVTCTDLSFTLTVPAAA